MASVSDTIRLAVLHAFGWLLPAALLAWLCDAQVGRDSYGGKVKSSYFVLKLFLGALSVLVGCADRGEERHGALCLPQPSRRSRPVGDLSAVSESNNSGNGSVGVDEKVEMERMLETGLAAVATDRRLGALGVLAEQLWRHLDSMTTNHAVCALLASARSQAFVEHELASVRVPERTVDMGPVLRAADGTHYRETTVERARAAAAERRTIARTREYLCQLRHFSENYPNRIDADALRRLYLSLNDDERREVMSRMVSILGRRPKWAPQREGDKR